MKGMERVAIIVVNTRGNMLEADRTDAGKLMERMLEKRGKPAQDASEKPAKDGLAKKLTKLAGEKLAGKTAVQLGKDAVGIFELVKKNDNKFASVDTLAKQVGTFLKGAASYGIYIIMHGTTDGYPTPDSRVLRPPSIADVLRRVMEEHGNLQAFKKLNLVACNLGAEPTALFKENRLDAPFAEALCQELKNEATMVAAYTVPVYVYWPDNPELKPEFGVPAPTMTPDRKLGQRLFRPPNPSLESTDLVTATAMAADNRATYKAVWQWQGGKAVRVPLDKYHAHK